jgi:branched-chain amino acid aminotransferase
VFRYLLHNGQIREANEQRLVTPGQVGLLNGWGVFSTIRVLDGVLFEYERHWARMKRDAELMRVPFPAEPVTLERDLRRLVEANQAPNSTLRVVVIRNRGGMWETPGIERDYDVVAFLAPLNKWGEAVRLGVIPDARHAANRFAGTKILSWAQNLAYYEEARVNGFDEVVLLNERGEVSECTSANIFIIRGTELITPPLDSGCLPGITRMLLVEEIRLPGWTVREQALTLEDLEKADAVFITSSTRDLLPVASIEKLNIRHDEAKVAAWKDAFRAYQTAYFQKRRATQPV